MTARTEGQLIGLEIRQMHDHAHTTPERQDPGLRGEARKPAPVAPAAARPDRKPRGQSLVEFALVLPLFLLILAGIVDFGLGLYSNITVINAAREGARVSITSPGDLTAVEARVRAMSGGLNGADLSVTTTCQHPDPSPATTWSNCTGTLWQSGDAVAVRVDYVYRMIWPLASGTTIPLSSTVRMRIE